MCGICSICSGNSTAMDASCLVLDWMKKHCGKVGTEFLGLRSGWGSNCKTMRRAMAARLGVGVLEWVKIIFKCGEIIFTSSSISELIIY